MNTNKPNTGSRRPFLKDRDTRRYLLHFCFCLLLYLLSPTVLLIPSAILLVFWFLSRISWYGRGRSNVPWSQKGDREKARIAAPFYNFRQRSPNSCLGRGTSRARTRKAGPFSRSIERRVSLSTTGGRATYYVGIDVSKATLYVAILPTEEHFVVANDEGGIDELLGKLAEQLAGILVVLEASGGFERPAVATLAASGVALFVLNPRQARDFAKATGKLAKTDRV